jgi:HJR/Mrr/RecB family endonuclease
MFQVIAGGLAAIAFGLALLVGIAIEHPWLTAGFLALLVVFVVLEMERQKTQVIGLGAGVDLATMSPIEYEAHCAELLRATGWAVQQVGRVGDQGVDVIGELRGTRVAVQCKKYTRPAGNSAVQQIVAGKRHHGCAIAVVCAPAGYTTAAQQLAHTNGVLLLSHVDLPALERLARVP